MLEEDSISSGSINHVQTHPSGSFMLRARSLLTDSASCAKVEDVEDRLSSLEGGCVDGGITVDLTVINRAIKNK